GRSAAGTSEGGADPQGGRIGAPHPDGDRAREEALQGAHPGLPRPRRGRCAQEPRAVVRVRGSLPLPVPPTVSTPLVLFEDSHWRDLRPLTDLLPVPALAFGDSSLGARLERAFGLPLRVIAARAEAMALWRDAPDVDPGVGGGAGEALAVNAAVLPGPWIERLKGGGPALLESAGRIVAARLA